MQGKTWPERVRKAEVREHDEQAYCACNALQDPEVEQFFRFSQDLKMWCTEAIDKARVQKLKNPGRLFYQNELELTRLALKQMKDLGLTEIPSDKDSGFVLMKLSDISALQEEILVGKGYNEIYSARNQYAEHVEVLVEVGENRQRP